MRGLSASHPPLPATRVYNDRNQPSTDRKKTDLNLNIRINRIRSFTTTGSATLQRVLVNITPSSKYCLRFLLQWMHNRYFFRNEAHPRIYLSFIQSRSLCSNYFHFISGLIAFKNSPCLLIRLSRNKICISVNSVDTCKLFSL